MRMGVNATLLSGSVAGFVLAGGRSSRMGRDKALLDIGGEPLLVRIGRQVSEAAGSAVVIGDPERYGRLGFTVIPDCIAGLGPLGGLLTVLENTTARWNLVVACDMPSLTACILKELIMLTETAAHARCIVPVSGGAPEPLCAVYHRGCLPVVRRAADAGHLRMRDLVPELNSMAVPFKDAQVFENINNPAHWSAYRRLQST